MAGCRVATELGGVAGPVELEAVEPAKVRPGADSPAAGGVLLPDGPWTREAVAATGSVFFPEVEIAVGDSDFDFRPKLGVKRCRPKLRIRSGTFFRVIPDLLSLPSDIVQLLLGKF